MKTAFIKNNVTYRKCIFCKRIFRSIGFNYHLYHKHKLNSKQYLDVLYEKLSRNLITKILKDYDKNVPIEEIYSKYHLAKTEIVFVLQKNKRTRRHNRIPHVEKCLLCKKEIKCLALWQHVTKEHKYSFKDYKKEKLEKLESQYGKLICRDYKNDVSLHLIEKKYNRDNGLRFTEIKQILKKHNVYIYQRNRYLNAGLANKSYACWYFYKGKYFQGTWEFLYGLWLLKNKIKFKTHREIKPLKYKIKKSNHLYFPDFYLIDTKEYIDIKGGFGDKKHKIFKEKIKAVKKENDVKIIILYGKHLKKLNIFKARFRSIILDEYKIDQISKKNKITEFLKEHKNCKKELLKKYFFKKLSIKLIAKKYKESPGFIYGLFEKLKIPLGKKSICYYICCNRIFGNANFGPINSGNIANSFSGIHCHIRKTHNFKGDYKEFIKKNHIKKISRKQLLKGI